MLVRDEPKTKRRLCAYEQDDGNIDSVRRSTAHHTGYDHSRLAADSFSTSPANSCIFLLRFSTSVEVGSCAIVCLRALFDAFSRNTRSAARVTRSANLG